MENKYKIQRSRDNANLTTSIQECNTSCVEIGIGQLHGVFDPCLVFSEVSF